MKKGWKIAGIIAITIVGLLGAFLYWATWEGSTKEIESVAGQFKPGAGWKQIDNQVIPPQTTCLDVKCPSVHRSWTTDKTLTKKEFQQLLDNSGWKFNIRGNCEASTYTSGTIPICSAEGKVNKYIVSVAAWSSSDNESRVVLSVR